MSTQTEKTPETKTCPFCAEEIKWEATICKHCGKSVDGSDKPEKKPRPIIGFLGILLLFFGGLVCVFSGGNTASIWVTIIGGIILLVALFTGNIKFWGS